MGDSPIAFITLVVRDYDEAIAWFTQALRFALVEDTPMEAGKRWVLVAPAAGGAALLLARAVTPEQLAHVGNQTGGRVFLFLHTHDFWAITSICNNTAFALLKRRARSRMAGWSCFLIYMATSGICCSAMLVLPIGT